MQKYKDLIYYNRKEIITVIVCIISFFSFSFFTKENDTIVENPIDKVETKEIDNNKIIVDVKGEVNNPGTYELTSDNRIKDVIEKSGGLTNNANVESINLSEKLKDEMLIYIPSKEEEINIEIKTDKNKETVKETYVKDSKISINKASLSELMTLPGIGDKKAKAIIEYRENNGLFKDIKEITNVSGIGNSIFDKIKDSIKL